MAGNRRQRRRRRKPSTIVDSNRWLTRKHPNSGENRLRRFFSVLPPVNFSVQHHILFRRYSWIDEHYHNIRSAPAVTKSWQPPPTTRCGGASNRPPQLRRVAAARPKNPSPHDHTFECSISDPFDPAKKEFMELTSAVDHGGGKYFAISLQGAVAEMEVAATRRLEITAVGSSRAVPWSRFFKEYLFEMEGEMLLVHLIHHETVETVDDVKVFRLDLNKLDWIKVRGIKGKTMFLKERCKWVNSAEYGCRDNCVFFTQGEENEWRVFDFKTCCISSL